MKKRSSRFLLGLGTLLLSGCLWLFPAYAEEGDEPIKSLKLSVHSSIEALQEENSVEVDVVSGDAVISSVEVLNEPMGRWKEGVKPKVEVCLEAEDGYEFIKGIKSKNISLSGDEAKLTSCTRKDEATLRLVLTLKKLKGHSSDYELDTEEAEWDEVSGTAVWTESEDATAYEMRLYKDGRFVTNLTKTTEVTRNLAEYLKEPGVYSYEVKAIFSEQRKGDWMTSDELVVTEAMAKEYEDLCLYGFPVTGPASDIKHEKFE